MVIFYTKKQSFADVLQKYLLKNTFFNRTPPVVASVYKDFKSFQSGKRSKSSYKSSGDWR